MTSPNVPNPSSQCHDLSLGGSVDPVPNGGCITQFLEGGACQGRDRIIAVMRESDGPSCRVSSSPASARDRTGYRRANSRRYRRAVKIRSYPGQNVRPEGHCGRLAKLRKGRFQAAERQAGSAARSATTGLAHARPGRLRASDGGTRANGASCGMELSRAKATSDQVLDDSASFWRCRRWVDDHRIVAHLKVSAPIA